MPMFSHFVALDSSDKNQLEELVKTLSPDVSHFKIGLEATTAFGVPVVVDLVKNIAPDCQLFLDLKLHDIPNTVKKAVEAAAFHHVDFLSIHATTGMDALQAAVEVAGDVKLLGVSVLTSISEQECQQIYRQNPVKQVVECAGILHIAGVYGMVCSAQEAALIRQNPQFDTLKLVTPGIRPSWAVTGDQQRITTPAQAMQMGVDYLVIGRPITQAKNPKQAVHKILEEIQTVF